MKKLLTFLTLLTLFFGVSWAETTITYTLSGSDNRPSAWQTSGVGGYCTTSEGFTISFGYANFTKTGYIGWNSGLTYSQQPNRMTVNNSTHLIKSIVVTCANGNTSNIAITDGGGTLSITSTSFTWTNTIGANSVSFSYSSGKQLQVSYLDITYEEGATPSVDAPSISFDSFSNGDTEATANITAGSNSTTTYFKVGEDGTYAATNGTETIDLTSVEAPFTVYAYSSDGTNNSSEVSATFNLPALGVSVTPATYTGYEAQTVTITPSNYVGTPVVTYKINGGTEESYSSSFTLSNVGTYEVVAYVMDERANGTVVNSSTSTITIAEQPSGNTQTATYVFNDADELEALHITLPETGSGTSIAGNEYVKGSVTFTSTNGTNTNNPTRIWNSSGSYDLRLYSGATFTLSVPSNYAITSITIAGANIANISAPTVGTYSNGAWIGSAQDVTFNITGTTRINTIDVTYVESSASDMYILGMVNGNGIQPNQGVKMNYSNGSYSANIWVIGNSDNSMGVPGTWFAFTTVLANDNDDGGWSYVNQNRYSPTPDNGSYYWLNSGANIGTLASEVPLTKQNNNNAFLIPAGLYTITLTPSTTTGKDWDFNLTAIKDLTPTITPEGGEVALNSTATIALSEDFNTFIASCNPVVNASGSTVSITAPVVTLYVNGTAVEGTSSEYTFDTTGEVTLTGKGVLVAGGNDYAEKSASETYTVYESYNVTVADGITGGTVTASPKTNVREGRTVYVTVTPSNNYQLSTLIVDGTDVASQVSDGQYTFSMPAHNVEISATFTYTGAVGGETTYELITNETENPFEVGAKYLIVNESAQKALGGAANSAIDITITDHRTTISSESEVAQFVLGGSSTGWTFQNGDGYLTTTDDNNGISQNGTSSSTWTISFTSQGNAVITNGTYTTRQIRYYSATPNFRTYKNGGSGAVVQLYKETTSSLKAPVITPEGGTFLNSLYPNGITVTVSPVTEGSTIYVSTDGTNYTPYTAATTLTVTGTTTVSAYATKDDVTSETVSETYNLVDVILEDVQFSPIPGTYSGAQTLQMYTTNQNAKIYYTTDGTTPSATNGTLYSSSDVINLEVGNTYNFKAIAVLGNNTSDVAEGSYTINAASSSALNSVAELNSADEDEVKTMGNPFQIIYMNTWRNDGYTPEYAYIRDNTGYGLIYFGNNYYRDANYSTRYSVPNALVCEMGDWLPGGLATGTVKVWSDGFHNELGGSSYKETITAWPTSTSQLVGNTDIIPEEMTNANINAGWDIDNSFAQAFNDAFLEYCTDNNLDPENLEDTDKNAANAYAIEQVGGYSSHIQPNNVWGHYVHLRKNTIQVTNDANDPNATPDGTGTLKRHKYSGFVTDQSGEQTIYYDGFYLFSGYNGSEDLSNSYFEGIQDNGGTFDVYGIVGFYGPYAADAAHNFIPFEIIPIDFLYIYKPSFNIESGTYYETQTVTLTCGTEGATIWYKTSDMEDYAEYTGPITVDATTTIETYSSIPTKYNDVMESVVNTLIIDMGDIPQPVISPESGVFTIDVDEPVDATIAFEAGATVPEGTVIYFTVDGSDPKDESSDRYEYTAANIAQYLTDIDETTTVRAIAYLVDEVRQTSYYSREAEAKTYTFVKTNGIIYTLVTDQTQLNESSVYVIVNKDNHMAVSTVQNANNRGATGVKFVDETTKTQVEGNGDVALFMLTKVGNKWYIKTNNSDENGYLYVGNGNTLLTSGTAYESAEATINIDADTEHQAHISFVYDNALTRYLRYYDNGKLFSSYTSETSNLPVSLYYLEATPLANIEKEGKLNVQYTVADQLIAVYADVDKGILWCKDQGDASIDKTYPKDSQIDFLMNDANAQNGRDWDQSNWVALQFTEPSGSNHPVTTLLTNVEGKLIKQATIQGTYTNNVNFTITMAEDKLEFVEGQTAPYTKNEYCTANFLPENLNLTEQSTGAVNYGDDNKYFFMNPKIQEVCHITYAEWNRDKNCFTVPSTSGFSGAFTVDLEYNVQPDVNLSTYLTDGDIYQFQAIVRRTSINAYGPKDIEHNTDPNGAFKVYPLDLTSSSNIPTAINTVDVNGKAVKSVKYVNVAGIVSDHPFQGVNIVVTEYTDGTRTTSKMLRK